MNEPACRLCGQPQSAHTPAHDCAGAYLAETFEQASARIAKEMQQEAEEESWRHE